MSRVEYPDLRAGQPSLPIRGIVSVSPTATLPIKPASPRPVHQAFIKRASHVVVQLAPPPRDVQSQQAALAVELEPLIAASAAISLGGLLGARSHSPYAGQYRVLAVIGSVH